VEVAPFGVTPPPVGWLEPPVLPPPPVPPPVVPPPAVPPPVVPPLVPSEDELEPPEDDPAAEADCDAPLEEVVEVVLLVDVVLAVPVDAGTEIGTVGTVSGGAPDVSVAAEPLPHAAIPAATAAPAASAMSVRVARRVVGRRDTTGTSDFFEWVHPPAAMRTVVEILLAMLVAPVAEAKVLDRPRQLGWGWRQRQKLPDDLQRLTGLPIDVRPPGLCIDHDLTTGGRRPHPVLLTRPHAQPSYNRGRTPAAPAGWARRLV
jgi:hypothetical protein